LSSYSSALRVLPKVFERIGSTPQGVVDVGCGDGSWLLACKELGVKRVLGLDIHPAASKLESWEYVSTDLRRFDWTVIAPSELVLCLEVAEHLSSEYGPALVRALSKLGRVVLFSAATPGQGPYPPIGDPDFEGAWHHNEMPWSYWRDLFEAEGLIAGADLGLAEELEVDPWYRDNLKLLV
jgi:hypothetical protein